MWLKTSVLALGLVIVPFGGFVLMKELSHEHHHGKVYPHM
jgi:hypothetical protein